MKKKTAWQLFDLEKLRAYVSKMNQILLDRTMKEPSMMTDDIRDGCINRKIPIEMHFDGRYNAGISEEQNK